MELKHELALPVIKINFDETKAYLEKEMSIYQNIVVDEETYPLCKAKQKELAGLRNQIDEFRKAVKKEILKPYEEIEMKCSELASIIKQVEDPIREGTGFYDDKRKQEKIDAAKMIIDKLAEEHGLRSEYRSQIKMLTEYANLTATEKAVSDSVLGQIFTLKTMQAEEDNKIQLIKDTCKENDVKEDDFLAFFKKGMNLPDIIRLITKPIQKVTAADPEPEARMENVQIGFQQPNIELLKDDMKLYRIGLQFTATEPQVRAIANYIRSMGIVYKITENHEI